MAYSCQFVEVSQFFSPSNLFFFFEVNENILLKSSIFRTKCIYFDGLCLGSPFLVISYLDSFNTSVGSIKSYLSIVSGSCSSLLLPRSSHSRAGMFNTAGGIAVKWFILRSRWVSFNKLLSWRGKQGFQNKGPQCNLTEHSHW